MSEPFGEADVTLNRDDNAVPHTADSLSRIPISRCAADRIGGEPHTSTLANKREYSHVQGFYTALPKDKNSDSSAKPEGQN